VVAGSKQSLKTQYINFQIWKPGKVLKTICFSFSCEK
jgi:hypothetical protein